MLFTNEKAILSVAGKEFGESLEGCMLSGRHWPQERHQTLLRALRRFSSGAWFKPTRYDKTLWIRLNEDGQLMSMCVHHVDDFMVLAGDPEAVMDMIQLSTLLKSIGPPDYYLGNDYKKDRQG
jgi:hypothetical protein